MQESLETAWLLRNHVFPVLISAPCKADAVRLCSSSPFMFRSAPKEKHVAAADREALRLASIRLLCAESLPFHLGYIETCVSLMPGKLEKERLDVFDYVALIYLQRRDPNFASRFPAWRPLSWPQNLSYKNVEQAEPHLLGTSFVVWDWGDALLTLCREQVHWNSLNYESAALLAVRRCSPDCLKAMIPWYPFFRSQFPDDVWKVMQSTDWLIRVNEPGGVDTMRVLCAPPYSFSATDPTLLCNLIRRCVLASSLNYSRLVPFLLFELDVNIDTATLALVFQCLITGCKVDLLRRLLRRAGSSALVRTFNRQEVKRLRDETEDAEIRTILSTPPF